MAQFKKGEGGRPKGKPNKTTTDLRQFVTSLLDKNRLQIEKDFLALEPKDRVQAYERLLKFVLPTLAAVQVQTEFDNLSDQDLDKIIDNLKATPHEQN